MLGRKAAAFRDEAWDRCPRTAFRFLLQHVSRCINSRFALGCERTRCAEAPSLLIDPLVDILARRILAQAIAFLNFALELLALASDLIEIVIRKMTPLLLDLAL